MLRILCLMASLALATGCTTLADARDAKGAGQGENATYAAKKGDVWDAVVGYINESDLDLISENKSSGTILAQRGINLANYGDNVAVFIDALNESTTAVEAVHKKAMQTNIFGALWAQRIIEFLDKKFRRQ